MKSLTVCILAILCVLLTIASYAGFITNPTYHIKDLETINDGADYGYYDWQTSSLTPRIPVQPGVHYDPQNYVGVGRWWMTGPETYMYGLLTLDHNGTSFNSDVLNSPSGFQTPLASLDAIDSCADMSGSVYFLTVSHYFSPGPETHHYYLRIGRRAWHTGAVTLRFSEDEGGHGYLPDTDPPQTVPGHRRLFAGPRMVWRSTLMSSSPSEVLTDMYMVWIEGVETPWTDPMCPAWYVYLKIARLFTDDNYIWSQFMDEFDTSTPALSYYLGDTNCTGDKPFFFDVCYNPEIDRILIPYRLIRTTSPQPLRVKEINPNNGASTDYIIPNSGDARNPRVFCDSMRYETTGFPEPTVYLCFQLENTVYASVYNRGSTVPYEFFGLHHDHPYSISAHTNPYTPQDRILYCVYNVFGKIRTSRWTPSNFSETDIDIVKTTSRVFLSRTNYDPEINTVFYYTDSWGPVEKSESYIVWIGYDQYNNRHVYGRHWSNFPFTWGYFSCPAVTGVRGDNSGISWVLNTPSVYRQVDCGGIPEPEERSRNMMAEFQPPSSFTARSQIYCARLQRTSLTIINHLSNGGPSTNLRGVMIDDPWAPFSGTMDYSQTRIAYPTDPLDTALGGTGWDEGRDVTDVFNFWMARPYRPDYMVIVTEHPFPEVWDKYTYFKFSVGTSTYARMFARFIDWIAW